MSNRLSIFIIVGIYTIALISFVHYYEAKIKDYLAAIADLNRALGYAKNSDNQRHYTALQLENKQMKSNIVYLSQANDLLQNQNIALKKHNNELINGILPKAGESRDMQYESSTYKSSLYETHNAYSNQIELELDPIVQTPFVRKYGPKIN